MDRLRHGFSASALRACGVDSSIPDLFSLDDRSTPLSSMTAKNVSRDCQVPSGAENGLQWESVLGERRPGLKPRWSAAAACTIMPMPSPKVTTPSESAFNSCLLYWDAHKSAKQWIPLQKCVPHRQKSQAPMSRCAPPPFLKSLRGSEQNHASTAK